MRGGPWTAPLGVPADLQTPPLSPRSGLWLREGHAGRGLLRVPLCALLRHTGVGSREQVQPPLPLPCRRFSCGWGRPPGPGGAEGRACDSPAGVGAGGGGRHPARSRACVGGGGGSGGGPSVPWRLQVLHGVLLDLCPGPFRDPGDMAAEDCLEAWEVHRAFVIQFLPEGANCEHHVVGLREERLGVGDPHVPEARRARGLYLYGSPHGSPSLGDVGGVAAPEVLDGALAVCRQECAELANVLLEGGCLPLQLLL